jgi:putative membrane-bound dehydrogenase-like protein
MKRLVFPLLLVLLVSAWPRAADPQVAEPNTVKLNGHTFTLPPGFTIELVAGPPLVDRPIACDFDELGRLYVTDSSGSSEKVSVQLEKKPHRVVRLESTRGDGKFDKQTVFADKMMFPEGILYHKGSVYVAAPPSIWKLTDTKDIGVADKRSEWFQGKTLNGCANDLHGPYLGLDGCIYWCKGAFEKQTYTLPNNREFKTRAAHIFRALPDGSGVEPVMTGGMDNPVDVVFTPGGERIFTTTFLQYPAGGKRDGLIHAVYGGIYGKEFHDVIDPHIWTGPSVLPPLTHLGAAAPAGLHRYEADAFGPEYRDNLFCCCFNMQKVTRHVLTPSGATFKTQDSDFLVSDNKDFHPTDVIEDADGSLLVVDTGGWYRICCPTSQLQKPEVLGAIYRIRKTGMPKVDDARGLKIDWTGVSEKEVTRLLDDGRVFVRRRAIESLAHRKKLAVVADLKSPQAMRNAIWSATRVSGEPARQFVRAMIEHPDSTVRQAALQSIALWRDAEASPTLEKLLKRSSDNQNRRAAAEALGRIGHRQSVPALLWVLEDPCDAFLEHSVIYALIEIGYTVELLEATRTENPRVMRALLIALDQIPDGKLTAERVLEAVQSHDQRLRDAAWWIAGRHPEWGDAVAGSLRRRLNLPTMPPEEQQELERLLSRFLGSQPVQAMLAEQLADAKATMPSRLVVLRAMGRVGAKGPPTAWLIEMSQILQGKDEALVQQAIATARNWRDLKVSLGKLPKGLHAVAADKEWPASIRISAQAALPKGLQLLEPGLFELLRDHLGLDQPAATRSTAADALSRAKLSGDQLKALTPRLKTIGPMELDRVLEGYTGCSDDDVGKGLIAVLKTASAKSSLRVEFLKPRLAKFGPAVQEQAKELYAALNVDAGKQQAHLEKVLGELKDGDISRGRTVFNSQKAACFTCHAIGYLGGNLGPDLTRIGRIRTDRDLVESILFPSASFVRGYEPVVVTRTDGTVVNGILRKDLPDEIVLAVAANQEVRIPRDQIDDVRPSAVSVMPAGLDDVLTRQELADLVAFLKSCK